MQPGEAEGLLCAQRPASAANEDVADPASAQERQARPHSGWDAYEVWLTRIKAPGVVIPERERQPPR